MIAIMWQFEVKAGKEKEFEALYGAHGDWTTLNRRTRSYLGTSFLRFGKMTEQGAASQNAVIHHGSEIHLWAEPAVGARYDVKFVSGSSLRLFARTGVLHYLSGTSSKVRAGLEGAQGDTAPMRVNVSGCSNPSHIDPTAPREDPTVPVAAARGSVR